jgi:hypothetical protein
MKRLFLKGETFHYAVFIRQYFKKVSIRISV